MHAKLSYCIRLQASVSDIEPGATFLKLLRKVLGRFLILGKIIGKYLARH